jgi:3-keto-L-gulonate-6-phosphate decarboxylase
MFVNTDQSIAGSYITKKSDITKEEKKIKKRIYKKKEKSR